jgi:hypothetical protein
MSTMAHEGFLAEIGTDEGRGVVVHCVPRPLRFAASNAPRLRQPFADAVNGYRAEIPRRGGRWSRGTTRMQSAVKIAPRGAESAEFSHLQTTRFRTAVSETDWTNITSERDNMVHGL